MIWLRSTIEGGDQHSDDKTGRTAKTVTKNESQKEETVQVAAILDNKPQKIELRPAEDHKKRVNLLKDLKNQIDIQKPEIRGLKNSYILGSIDPQQFINDKIHKTIDLDIATPYAKYTEVCDVENGWEILIENKRHFKITLEKEQLRLEAIGKNTNTKTALRQLLFSALVFRTTFANSENPQSTHRINLGKPSSPQTQEIGEAPILIDLPLPETKDLPPLLITTTLVKPARTFQLTLDPTDDGGSKNKDTVRVFVNKLLKRTKNGFMIGISSSTNQSTDGSKQPPKTITEIRKEQKEEYKTLIDLLNRSYYQLTSEDFRTIELLFKEKESEFRTYNKDGSIKTVDDWIKQVGQYRELNPQAGQRDSRVATYWRETFGSTFLTNWLNSMREAKGGNDQNPNAPEAEKIYQVNVSCDVIAKTATGEEFRVPVLKSSKKIIATKDSAVEQQAKVERI